MLNPSTGNRELCYLVKVDDVKPIPGRDKVESAIVGGWTCMVQKDVFKPGSLGVYFEVDSKCPPKEPFLFLAKRDNKIKIQKFAIKDESGNRIGQYWSQGLLMPLESFVINNEEPEWLKEIRGLSEEELLNSDKRFLTEAIGVTYIEAEDNKRKAKPVNKYAAMSQRLGKKSVKWPYRWLLKTNWGKKLLFVFYGKKKDNKDWPVGKFPGVSKTDQERVENMPQVLTDKSPFIVTEKCDGSSGTYILERKGKNKYEFYVCSRNVRMYRENQECYYGNRNYYWEVAKKYNIEEKMKDYLALHPECKWVCWQGEICAPGIQKNPHGLEETRFYCFHWTDSVNGRLSIDIAALKWAMFGMDAVPILDTNYILPDDFEELKASADGFYDEEVCEGKTNCKREGLVYYKVSDPTFSFKNVSREYLLKH